MLLSCSIHDINLKDKFFQRKKIEYWIDLVLITLMDNGTWWDDSNKWSKIGFGDNICIVEIKISTLSWALWVINLYFCSGSEDGKAYLWDRHHRVLLTTLQHQEGVVNGIAFSPVDEETCITVCDDRLIKIWRSKNKLRASHILR